MSTDPLIPLSRLAQIVRGKAKNLQSDMRAAIRSERDK